MSVVVDAGPLIALFDPKDAQHDRCVGILRGMREPLVTTIPVLTEAFHLLGPASTGSDRLRDFVLKGGLALWYFDDRSVVRAFELMERYADQSMDLADASLVVAAERLATRKVFTIDRRDFTVYRVKRGHRHYAFDVLGGKTP
jgi:predicted nucleic acid-binding protein